MSENTTTEVPSPKPVSGEKKSTLKIFITAIKVVTTVALLGPAGFIVYLHNFFNLTEGRGYYDYRVVVTNGVELEKAITEQIKASAWMNWIEIGIWILIPSLAILGAIALWKRTKFLVVVGLFVFVALFSTAQITNLIGVNKEVEEEVPGWKGLFEIIEYPGVNRYDVEASDDFENGFWGSMSFKTSEDISSVEMFYKSRDHKPSVEKTSDGVKVSAGFSEWSNQNH